MIFLDNASTTAMNEDLMQVIKAFSCENFYNPSASYKSGLDNAKFLQNARGVILSKLGFLTGTIIFTSGATESNNLAIKGSFREGKSEYLFSKGEHPSVFALAKNLKDSGKNISFIPLQKNGEIDYIELENNINENTRLVSCIWVSNETGVINDIAKISSIIQRKNPKTLLHIDATQGFCKIPMKFDKIKVDFLSFSGHKFHAPKGVGGLYVKDLNSLKNLSFGGEQEFSKRAGTENLPLIMAMTKQIENCDIRSCYEKVIQLKESFLAVLDKKYVSIIEGDSPYILSLSFDGVNGETLMRSLENEVIFSTGSACSSKKAGNRILEEMKFDKNYIKSSVRISFNSKQTVEDVENAGKIIMEKYIEILGKVR